MKQVQISYRKPWEFAHGFLAGTGTCNSAFSYGALFQDHFYQQGGAALNGQVYGYIRVSSREQNEERQLISLREVQEQVPSQQVLRVQSHDVPVHVIPLSLLQNMQGSYSDAYISLL